jgi:hypothetical protein
MQSKLKKTMLVPYIGFAFIILAFVFSKPLDLWIGLKIICTSPSILLTDYIAIAGLGSSLLNSGIMIIFSYSLVKLTKTPISGPVFAGILTIAGFSFFGKNLLNTSIIFFGVFLYSKYKKMSLRSVIVVMLFSSGLAPISSLIMFGLDLNLLIGIPLGIVVGLVSGFILVEMAPHVIKFHNGYDLYNVGFAGGILAILTYGIIKMTSKSYIPTTIYSVDNHTQLVIILISIILVLMIIGFIANDKSFKNYLNILKKSGRAITDFTRKDREGISLFNAGLTGLIVIVISLILGVEFNGPVFGAVLTVIGFGCFGKHPRNIWPGMLGVILSAYLFDIEYDSIFFALALIFSTTLAPIAGEFGIIPGIIAGMLHVPALNNLSPLHGGIILYSNGFAAAFTALVINMVMISIERKDILWQSTKLKKTSR